MNSIPMPILYLDVPELIEQLPQTDISKDLPYKKENRLEMLSRKASQGKQSVYRQTVLDLSLKEIFSKIISTINAIVEEIIDAPEYSIREFINIFTLGDRMVYIGLFLVTIAILFFLIEISS